MDKNRFRTPSAAIVLAVGAGAARIVAAQPDGRSGRDMMNWGDTNQYGSLGVLIGVAVLVLLVVLVMRVTRK